MKYTLDDVECGTLGTLSLACEYYYYPAEDATRDYPGCPMEFDFISICIEGTDFDLMPHLTNEVMKELQAMIEEYAC